MVPTFQSNPQINSLHVTIQMKAIYIYKAKSAAKSVKTSRQL